MNWKSISAMVLLAAYVLWLSFDDLGKRKINKDLWQEVAGLRKALDQTQKPSLFPHCVTMGTPDTEEWTVCGSIESIEVGNDRWDKKEVAK